MPKSGLARTVDGEARMDGFSEPLASHGSWEYDLATRAVSWSDGALPHPRDRPAATSPPSAIRSGLIHPEDLGEYERIVADAIESRSPFTVQHRIVRPDGAVRTVIVRGGLMPASNGGRARLVGTTQDVTGRTGYEERLWHLANQDSLTGLFNRRRFAEELAREVAVARRTGEVGAVLILDLDRFKEVNDCLGHMAGDMLHRPGRRRAAHPAAGHRHPRHASAATSSRWSSRPARRARRSGSPRSSATRSCPGGGSRSRAASAGSPRASASPRSERRDERDRRDAARRGRPRDVPREGRRAVDGSRCSTRRCGPSSRPGSRSRASCGRRSRPGELRVLLPADHLARRRLAGRLRGAGALAAPDSGPGRARASSSRSPRSTG